MKTGQAFRGRMRGELGAVGQEFDLLNASLNEWREKEHGIDGNHTNITADSMVVSGEMTWGGPIYLHANAVCTPAQITANTNDYNPPGIDEATWLRIQTDASRNLTGIKVANTNKHRLLLLTNVGTQNIVLKHNVTSTPRYRFACPGSVDYTLTASVWVLYDQHIGNWRVIDQ